MIAPECNVAIVPQGNNFEFPALHSSPTTPEWPVRYVAVAPHYVYFVSSRGGERVTVVTGGGGDGGCLLGRSLVGCRPPHTFSQPAQTKGAGLMARQRTS